MSAFAKKTKRDDDEERKENKRALLRLTQCCLMTNKTLETASRSFKEIKRLQQQLESHLEATARKSGINPHLIKEKVLKKYPDLGNEEHEFDPERSNTTRKAGDNGFCMGQKESALTTQWGLQGAQSKKGKKKAGNMSVYNLFKKLTTAHLQKQFENNNEGYANFFEFSTQKTSALWASSPLNKACTGKYNERDVLIVMKPFIRYPDIFKLITDRSKNAKNAVDDHLYTQRLLKDIEENPPTKEYEKALMASVTLEENTAALLKAVHFSSDTKTSSVDDPIVSVEAEAKKEEEIPEQEVEVAGKKKKKNDGTDEEESDEDDEDDEDDEEDDEDENIESSEEE